mgnify:CR=1 FL=1
MDLLCIEARIYQFPLITGNNPRRIFRNAPVIPVFEKKGPMASVLQDKEERPAFEILPVPERCYSLTVPRRHPGWRPVFENHVGRRTWE